MSLLGEQSTGQEYKYAVIKSPFRMRLKKQTVLVRTQSVSLCHAQVLQVSKSLTFLWGMIFKSKVIVSISELWTLD